MPQPPAVDPRVTEKSLPWRPAPPLAPEHSARAAGILDAMTRLLADHAPASDAEALKLLRGAYPELPLALRLAALAARIKTRPETHIPR
jgi:hypothetical protein